VGRVLLGLRSLIPLYVVACVIVDSLAPWRSNSFGMLRSRLSWTGLFTASLASRSASSLPALPAWPLVHWKDVGAMRCFRTLAVVLKSAAFLMPIHPLSSQVLRCLVRPSMAYRESEMILRGNNFGIAVAALRIATISPTWLDWLSPEGRKAKFLWSLGPK